MDNGLKFQTIFYISLKLPLNFEILMIKTSFNEHLKQWLVKNLIIKKSSALSRKIAENDFPMDYRE